MAEIKGKNAEIVWKKVLRYLMENGHEFVDRNNRKCKECLNVIAKLETTEKITKPIQILNSFDKWVYPSIEELKSAVLGKAGFNRYYYDYAKRIFNNHGINQVDDYIIPLLKKEPFTRRATIVLFSPKTDSHLKKKEAPGMISLNFNIRDNKIHVTCYIRSNDFFYGWPGNITQIYFLSEYISKKINHPIADISTISVSCHIFEDEIPYIERILNMKR